VGRRAQQTGLRYLEKRNAFLTFASKSACMVRLISSIASHRRLNNPWVARYLPPKISNLTELHPDRYAHDIHITLLSIYKYLSIHVYVARISLREAKERLALLPTDQPPWSVGCSVICLPHLPAYLLACRAAPTRGCTLDEIHIFAIPKTKCTTVAEREESGTRRPCFYW
jgi:hypothetical protein